MTRWMESLGSCNAHLVAPAGCRVQSLKSPAQRAQPLHTGWLPFRSLKGNKGKVRNQTFSEGQRWQAKCKMAYVISWYSIKIIPYSKSYLPLSLEQEDRKYPVYFSHHWQERLWRPIWSSNQQRSLLLKERKKGFQFPPPPLGSQGPPWLPRCRFRSPQSVKPRVGSESSCRVGSPRVKIYSCTATTEALAGSLMKWEKTRCPAARRTTCEIQHAPRMGSQAKANRTLWPSPPGTWAPGIQPSKQAHPSLKHRSKAWVQGPHQACFLASPGATPGPTLGPVEREKGLRVLLASQFPVGSLCRPQLYIH